MRHIDHYRLGGGLNLLKAQRQDTVQWTVTGY